jgi:hypothetical protein
MPVVAETRHVASGAMEIWFTPKTAMFAPTGNAPEPDAE